MPLPPDDVRARLAQLRSEFAMRAALQSEYDKEMSGKYIHEMIPFADWLAQRNAPTGKAHGGQPNLDVMRLAIGGQGPKNWMKGSVEDVIQPLKQDVLNEEGLRNLEARTGTENTNAYKAEKAGSYAINQWIDRNLTNYIKKQMATHDDPIRKLAEQGIVHMPPEQMGYGSSQANMVRKKLGAPQLGQSPEAQAWEDAADVSMYPNTVGEINQVKRLGGPGALMHEPWMEKADPETKVWKPLDNMHAHYLGFDHLVDILKQDLASGRIRPEQLSKVSIEQAVRRAHEYDQERKKAMAETALKATEGMPVHKDYGDGFKWIELTLPKDLPDGWTEKELPTGRQAYFDPEGNGSEHPGMKSLADALKYEGDTMGHCVGGYTPDVASGKSRIFSLRDAKNEPHVTVEVKPNQYTPRWDSVKQYMDQAREQVMSARSEKGLPLTDQYENEIERLVQATALEMAQKNAPPNIVQIKGKNNAKPKKDYIPYVQDFVRSGNWSEVNDFRNTDLIRKSDLIDKFSPEELDAVGKGEYLTHGEHSDLLLKALQPPKGKAHGGITHAHHLEIEERRL